MAPPLAHFKFLIEQLEPVRLLDGLLDDAGSTFPEEGYVPEGNSLVEAYLHFVNNSYDYFDAEVKFNGTTVDSYNSYPDIDNLYVPINYEMVDNGTLSVHAWTQWASCGWPYEGSWDIAEAYNVQPGATLEYDSGDEEPDFVASLTNPDDPSSADVAAGFHYSFSYTYAGLASSYAEADTATSFEFTEADEDGIVWARIFDKDGGYSDYNTSYVIPTANFGVVRSDSVQVTWLDLANNETGWYVQRALYGGNFSTIATLDANTTAYIDTNVDGNTHYQYRVRAYGTPGTAEDTAWSAKRAVWTLDPPAAPSGLVVADAANGQYTLTWQDNSNDEDGFYVEHSGDGVTWARAADLGADYETYTTSGLSQCDCNYLRVSAYKDHSLSVTQVVQAVFNDPSDVHALTISSTQINITWKDNSTEEDEFLVQYATNDSFTTGVRTLASGKDTCSKWITGLAANTPYYFRVRAVKTSGDSTGYSSGTPVPSATTAHNWTSADTTHWFDITHYGAIANDGMDDRAAIQAAINHSAPGDIIYFPLGTFDMYGSDPNDTRVNAKGGGRIYLGKTILTTAADGTTSASNGTILKSHGTHSNPKDNAFFLVHENTAPSGMFNMKFSNLTIEGAFGIYGDIVGGVPVDGVVISDCRFNVLTGSNHVGVQFSGFSNTYIINSMFDSAAQTWGIWQEQEWHNVVIANNQFSGTAIVNNELTGNTGMHLQSSQTTSTNLLVEQNHFIGIKNQAVEIQGHSNTGMNHDLINGTIVQDNYYENSQPYTYFTGASFAFSIPASGSNGFQSYNTISRRNYIDVTNFHFKNPNDPNDHDQGLVYIFELGGQNFDNYDNYSVGGNAVQATDGGADGYIRNNQYNPPHGEITMNGKTQAYKDAHIYSNGSGTVLTWDLSRPKPAPNRRVYGLALDTTNHVLRIDGTALSDGAAVELVGSDLVLTLNGEPFVMPASSVDTIKLAHRSTIASLTDVFFLPDVSILDDVVLDLTDNGVAIDYTGTSNITAVANYLANNRIISSSTATNRHLRYGDNALLGVTTFGAQPVDASSILVRFTYDGDANLDGMVEGRDLYILGINWHQSGKTWVQADFNGDGYVDAADLTFISVNWQAGV